MSQRKNIIKVLIDNLKLIDGTSSPLLYSYSFKSNLHENVFKGFKGFDEVNDFPCIFVTGGTENRTYNTNGTTRSDINVLIRAYTYNEENELVNEELNNLIQDIDHVIYNLPRNNTDLEILDIIIKSISSDEGLLTPYGVVELQVQVSYEVNL